MKVLLLKDVYKLGRAGEVKKVANGYGRNYLIPQGLAVLATPGALKNAERIRAEAEKRRAILNQEMSGIAEQVQGMQISFEVKAGDTGKMYGSVTPQDVANAINEKLEGLNIKRQQIEMQPIRMLGVHKVHVRLTMDLTPEVDVIVYREGETPQSVMPAEPAEEAAAEEPAAEEAEAAPDAAETAE